MGRVLILFAVLLLCTGCAIQARTPWGNLDTKGGSGSECKPWVAPDAGAGHVLPAPKVVRPVPPVPALQPVPVPAVPEPPSVEVSGGPWPPKVVKDLACID